MPEEAGNPRGSSGDQPEHHPKNPQVEGGKRKGAANRADIVTL
jgi:hypothetical protein